MNSNFYTGTGPWFHHETTRNPFGKAKRLGTVGGLYPPTTRNPATQLPQEIEAVHHPSLLDT